MPTYQLFDPLTNRFSCGASCSRKENIVSSAVCGAAYGTADGTTNKNTEKELVQNVDCIHWFGLLCGNVPRWQSEGWKHFTVRFAFETERR